MGSKSSTSRTRWTASGRSGPVNSSAARARTSAPRPDSISALSVALAVRSGALQRVPRQFESLHAFPGIVVVGVGNLHEAHAAIAQRLHAGENVVGTQGDVLHAGPVVVLDVLLDLALAQSVGGFVDRHDDLRPVPHYGGDERGVLG